MHKALLTTCALGLVACNHSSLTDPSHTKTWATTASAVAVFAQVHDPLAYADAHFTFADPACPVTADDGTNVTITGGCTDSAGVAWTGHAMIARGASGDRTLTLDHYGKGGNAATGTFVLHAMSATMHGFDASFRVEGGETTTYTYSGTVAGTWDAPTTWSGSGTVQRDGLAEPTGTVSASTTDERLDSTVCSGQPVSGSTTISGGGHVAVVTYDGDTHCVSSHEARWSLDGVDQGLIAGIDCSTVPGRAVPGAPVVATLGLAGLALVRRRARSGTRKRL